MNLRRSHRGCASLSIGHDMTIAARGPSAPFVRHPIHAVITRVACSLCCMLCKPLIYPIPYVLLMSTLRCPERRHSFIPVCITLIVVTDRAGRQLVRISDVPHRRRWRGARHPSLGSVVTRRCKRAASRLEWGGRCERSCCTGSSAPLIVLPGRGTVARCLTPSTLLSCVKSL